LVLVADKILVVNHPMEILPVVLPMVVLLLEILPAVLPLIIPGSTQDLPDNIPVNFLPVLGLKVEVVE
jgi:hypothetical protein